MRKAIKHEDWERLIRKMIERIGAKRMAELIDYVIDERTQANASLLHARNRLEYTVD